MRFILIVSFLQAALFSIQSSAHTFTVAPLTENEKEARETLERVDFTYYEPSRSAFDSHGTFHIPAGENLGVNLENIPLAYTPFTITSGNVDCAFIVTDQDGLEISVSSSYQKRDGFLGPFKTFSSTENLKCSEKPNECKKWLRVLTLSIDSIISPKWTHNQEFQDQEQLETIKIAKSRVEFYQRLLWAYFASSR